MVKEGEKGKRDEVKIGSDKDKGMVITSILDMCEEKKGEDKSGEEGKGSSAEGFLENAIKEADEHQEDGKEAKVRELAGDFPGVTAGVPNLVRGGVVVGYGVDNDWESKDGNREENG